ERRTLPEIGTRGRHLRRLLGAVASVLFTLPSVEPTVGACLGMTEFRRDRSRAVRRYRPLLRGLRGDADRLLERLDAFPHQPLRLLLAARTRRLRDILLRRIESLHQRRRHVLARAEGLREGHLDGAPAGTRPHTGRCRRIHERSLIDAHSTLPLIMRDAHRHAPRAAPAPPV